MCDKIISKARELRIIVEEFERQTKIDWPKDIYDVLANHDFAPLIGVICDGQMKVEDAYNIPLWFLKKLRSLEPDVILKENIEGLIRSYFDHKGESKPKNIPTISKWIREAIKYFKAKNTTPIEIFEDREYLAPEVYFMLRDISGIGPKKANMIVRDFIYMSEGLAGMHPWFDQIKRKRPKFKVAGAELTFVPVDIHVKRVFSRMLGNSLRNLTDYDIQMFSRLVFPEFPARLDLLLWNVGREYCKRKRPKCSECIIKDICDYAKPT